jgi:hypothetical protein
VTGGPASHWGVSESLANQRVTGWSANHWRASESLVGKRVTIWKGIHQRLAYADDVNIVGENVYTIQKNRKALLDTNKVVGLQVNPEKTKYMLMSQYHQAGQKHSIKVVHSYLEDVAKFKHLGTMKQIKIA